MSDITTAPEQDAIADSLMGEEPQEQTAETPGTEAQETFQADQPDVEQYEPETEENADDWLPGEQDKIFPDDQLLRYAQRYNRDENWLSDPLNRQLLVDKLNSDIFLRQQQSQETEQFEPEPEYQQPEQQLPTREQYFAQIDRMIQERTDPQVAKEFHSGFLKAFGVPDAEIAKMPAEQAQQFTQLMSRFGLNLVNTFIGDLLQSQLTPQISQAFPGFQDMYEKSSYAMSWDQVRNSNPQFNELPAYGTKEFRQTIHEAADRFPELVQAFTGPDGKIPTDKAASAYSLLAKIATGQHVDPALLQKASAAGAKNARRADIRRSAGNLGSGQSKAGSGQQRASSKFQSNTDLFDDATMDLYHREHGRL
jgi:hypothetical protein